MPLITAFVTSHEQEQVVENGSDRWALISSIMRRTYVFLRKICYCSLTVAALTSSINYKGLKCINTVAYGLVTTYVEELCNVFSHWAKWNTENLLRAITTAVVMKLTKKGKVTHNSVKWANRTLLEYVQGQLLSLCGALQRIVQHATNYQR